MHEADLAQSDCLHPFENPGARWTEAMRAGDFERAWRINDWVLARRSPDQADDPSLPYHLRFVWDGRPFDGRDVLVRCYHGLGDTLQFSRYLEPLRRRVRSLALEVQPELIPLLAALPGPDRLIPFRPDAPAPREECDLEIMELAHALRLRPRATPYLQLPFVPGERGRGPLRVGLCWHVNSAWAPERSIAPGWLLPLARVPGVARFSLQRGPGAAEMAAQLDVSNPGEHGTDMLETARLILSLDLVVTVDTMVAHLAGALGVPVWLLLVQEPDWRWLAGGRGSPWYAKLRKYQQIKPGDWSHPVAELAVDLTRAAGGNSVAGT